MIIKRDIVHEKNSKNFEFIPLPVFSIKSKFCLRTNLPLGDWRSQGVIVHPPIAQCCLCRCIVSPCTAFYHMSLWTWNQNGNDLTNSYAQWFRTQLERFWFTVRCWMTKFMCQSTCIRSISQRFHCHCSGSLLIVVFVAVVFLSISSPLALSWLISMTSKGYLGHCILS